ncbi:BQ5605_C018g08779 [Microbotryum silenes-dioicae]|uniref:BQ5605_C018g08779 protein n=1 Tax=Microbotryum silenes-dioicae TaxID=796604 RepID=A0A2X0M0Y4_9BASI|nr:BQ5605_C018g08779 [Microbotryum silenes-dioicae]
MTSSTISTSSQCGLIQTMKRFDPQAWLLQDLQKSSFLVFKCGIPYIIRSPTR